MVRTVPREPWRGGQLCGERLEYGVVPGRMRFCAERKGDGKFFCPTHDEEIREQNNGILPLMAEGNAVGNMSLPVRLLWEPHDGNPAPVEPTDEELAAYTEGCFVRGGDR